MKVPIYLAAGEWVVGQLLPCSLPFLTTLPHFPTPTSRYHWWLRFTSPRLGVRPLRMPPESSMMTSAPIMP